MWPVINRHFRSGRLSELNESVAVPLNPINNNRIDDRSGRPPSIPSPLPSDLNPEILDWIRTLDPAELERIYAILDKIQQLDPAEFLGLSLKEKNKKEEEEKRRETEKENEKGRESESSGIGGENQNGGEVEKEEESSTRNQYPLRPEAGDCWWYLKTGNCKFGSNCKFNHPRRRKNKQKVSKDKAKQREEFAEKQDQAEGKVCKDKTKQREDLAKSKVCNCIDDQSDHPLFIQSPLPSDLNPEILEWIQGLDPTELDRTYAIFDQFQQFDPAFENWNFNPSIVDEIRELSLKEREKKEEEEKERESEKENEMEREGKSSGIGGGNQNGGDVEEEVVAESSRRKQYPLRPKAGDCLLYLKTGSCKFGSNCKFNHPRGRKNKQVCKDKAKQRVELEEKQDQTESKKKVSKNKAKQKEELAEKHDRTESKVCKDRVKQRVELAKKPDQTKSQVCKDKEKQRVRLAEKPDQTESKVCKDKAKQRVELAKKPDLTKSKVSTDKAKQRERVDREARPDRKQDYYLFDVLYCPGRRKGEPSVAPALELNFMGLPIRPGKNDCLHYMGTGTCKYENSCPFNHPDPTPAEESRPQSAYESRGIHSETTEFITPSWD